MNLPEYITALGVNKTASEYSVTEHTVRNWLERRTIPEPAKANELIVGSKGMLSWESIYAPFYAAVAA